MQTEDIRFHRLFSKTMYKNLKLSLGEMSFTKDFVKDDRGDLYPVSSKSDSCLESVENNTYLVRRGRVLRRIGQFFPYATYELTFTPYAGSCGFAFGIPGAQATVTANGTTLTFTAGSEQQTVLPIPTCGSKLTLTVSCRPGAFDVYFTHNGQPCFLRTFAADGFALSNRESTFQKGHVCLAAEGNVAVHAASFYMDCGVSQADMRPIRYENGDVMVEQGKIYLTMSVRMQAGCYQGIFAWTPGTSEFSLTGALFYDSGDGYWQGDVAASILYHREKRQWLLWVCSFSHGHILGHAQFEGDPRFGVNVVDITLMKPADPGADIRTFAGFEGDEDPDFFYDAAEKKWYMAVCRLDAENRRYRYLFFTSHHPFEGYTCIGMGQPGEETGGSFVKIDGERVFACGNSFEKRSDYRIYTRSGMLQPHFDSPDGGFRGWGTVIPVLQGSRKRYYWLTFDRHRGSDYNWSYGNVYGFERTR